jgi:hypothetical protein
MIFVTSQCISIRCLGDTRIHHEIMGDRQRFRLIDLDRLCWRLRAGSIEEVRKNLEASLAERIARNEVKREPRWTESLAIGSVEYLKKVQPLILSRRETEIVAELDCDAWVLTRGGDCLQPKNGPEKRLQGPKMRWFSSHPNAFQSDVLATQGSFKDPQGSKDPGSTMPLSVSNHQT